MQTQIHAPVAEVVEACTEYVRASEAAMFPTPGVFSRCLAAEQRLIELINRRDPRDAAEPKSDEARDAERYRVLRDFDSGKTELAICRWSEHGWVGEWVIEHEPDAAIDAALAAQQTNVNR